MRKTSFIILGLPFIPFVVASIVYVIQHGFYGGDKSGDTIIAMMSFPYSGINWPMNIGDKVRFLFLPLAINLFIVVAVLALMSLFRKK